MILVVDRIIGNKFVCIDDATKNEVILEEQSVPKGTKEGHTLIYEDGNATYSKDLSKKRSLEIDKLLNDIFK